ncbi:MAG: phosphoribosylformylglycinamidine cyclo-ligase [Synergistaceae bacterium]|nr:phosphoribosylformylglycinamidine cyclo-ligase [Synergistaceae bacterium]
MDYKGAGVDIDAGEAWVGVVKRLVASREALPKAGGIGGFSGLYKIGGGRSLAACCDGVGTKLSLAKATGLYRGLGQDLVAMSVNDLVTCGAVPLFFLDYIACERLNLRVMEEIMAGILDGCEESECALLGGETAELPGIYPGDGFDLAGFAAGLIDDAKIIDGAGICEGDSIIGLPSSGIHSNGYSLARKALVDDGMKLSLEAALDEIGGETLGQALMRPTRIYVRQALSAISTAPVKGMAHITGGGLESNINRVMPHGLVSRIGYGLWERPGIFGIIARAGVDEAEMRRVFNLGIGYVFILSAESAAALVDSLVAFGESPVEVGRVVKTA